MIPIIEERSAVVRFARALEQCRARRATGRLRVLGKPGATVLLRDGAIVGVESPGSPGVAALLLRTGRIDEREWAALLRDAGSRLDLLTRRGALRAAELRLVAATAWEDAAFAAVAGRVEALRLRPGEVGAPLLREALDVDRLVAGLERKVDALTRMKPALSPYDDRIAAGPVGPLPWLTTPRQRDLLAHVDGRRTARDLAFLVGRGVYPVSVDLSVLLADRRLRVVTDEPGTRTGLRPLVLPRTPPPPPAVDGEPHPLPRRK